VIKDQVKQSERANDSAGEKSFGFDAPPDQIGIGGRDYGQRADPDRAMIATKFMPQRSQFAILK
jgi:hypothetical protein